jgi:hypothetical protein
LKNAMERAAVMVRGDTVNLSDLEFIAEAHAATGGAIDWPDEDLPSATARLEQMLSAAHIARPCMADEPRGGVRRKPLGRVGPGEKALGEGNDVGDVLPQRRQLDRHDVQSIKQVFPETAVAHALHQIAMGRRDHANADGNGSAADRRNDALLQRAQDLRLHGDVHLADLVEKQGFMLGFAEGALPVADE